MYRDKTDEKIIEFLRNDSRQSFVDIGKKLKLSESAVRRRVKNLVDAEEARIYAPFVWSLTILELWLQKRGL